MHSCSIPAPLTDRSEELSRLRFLARKVALVHGTGHPHTVELAALVSRLADTPTAPMSEADRATASTLTEAFAPWEGACGSVQALYHGLNAITNP